MSEGPHILILFDGVCNFCNASVSWLIAHDRGDRFRFAPLQSEAGCQRLRAHGFDEHFRGAMIAIDGGGVYVGSDAALRIASHLGWPWKMLTILRIVPRPLRELAYGWMARLRYRLAGRSETCRVPTPAVRAKFLG